MKHEKNLHPIHHRLLPREAREKLLRQRARVIWLTGLSGSGKSTLAEALEKKLHHEGKLVYVLDGDNVRTGINNNLGFSEADRKENIRRIAETAKLFLDCGVISICSFVSPTNDLRAMAKSIIGKNDFLEVYVNASLEECERRDVKGLYAKARRGEIPDFTGISAPFDVPAEPDLILNTETSSEEECLSQLASFVGGKTEYHSHE